MWGTAYDGPSVYVAEANPFHTPFTLSDKLPDVGGAWTALNPATGAIRW